MLSMIVAMFWALLPLAIARKFAISETLYRETILSVSARASMIVSFVGDRGKSRPKRRRITLPFVMHSSCLLNIVNDFRMTAQTTRVSFRGTFSTTFSAYPIAWPKGETIH